MRIALGQFDAHVGDLAGNVEKMRSMYEQAVKQNVDLLVFPELAVCGYPPEDLLIKRHFIEDNLLAVEKLAKSCPDITIVVGYPGLLDGRIYNCAAVLKNGKIEDVYRKGLLPNFGVFDEQRYFKAGDEPVMINIKGVNVAITICLDIWDSNWLKDFLADCNPIHMILNISASPFHVGKIQKRLSAITQCAQKFNAALCYCNNVGGQDELIFDGRSAIADSTGKIRCLAGAFEEELLIADLNLSGENNLDIQQVSPVSSQPAGDIEEVYKALVLGTRDYTRKNGFKKILLGVSGGIDSALVTSIAVAALGPENVIGITMPTRFNSAETISDATKLAENLGIEFYNIAIEKIVQQFHSSLKSIPGWDDKGTAYENLQARIRGTLLMSLSNQFGALVLTSGNKSETAVGYATLYGDTAGGFAVIKDIPKTLVYKLAEFVNSTREKPVIPKDILTRPPTAELREDQKDTDSLPDYDMLDEILKGYVEQDKSAKQLIESSFPKEVVRKVITLVDRNEYKRRQSPPGIKITPKAFGKDRRLPITNRYCSFNNEP
ncbi:MAG: NAD+ synthase [Planctomycetes bacterium]|nr:NAD+ synthase [Planctomycetota bacterium]